MLRTLNPRYPSTQIGRVLKEIPVAPDFLLGIVYGTLLPEDLARRRVDPLGKLTCRSSRFFSAVNSTSSTAHDGISSNAIVKSCSTPGKLHSV